MRSIGTRVGVSDHGGWAVLVTIAPSGTVLDRCKVDLKHESLPGLPHHDASRRLQLPQAIALVEKVRLSARSLVPGILEALESRLDCKVRGIALRSLPELPQSVAERITRPWANARADGAMFREELARVARARDWAIGWFDTRKAKEAMQSAPYKRVEEEASRRFAPPWNEDCRLALAGALAALPEEE